MGLNNSCCIRTGTSCEKDSKKANSVFQSASVKADQEVEVEQFNNLPHISERELDESEQDPSADVKAQTLFLVKFSSTKQAQKPSRRSVYVVDDDDVKTGWLRKYNSCSTIFVDDNTVSQPNLKSTIKCVALAVYYHIKQRSLESASNTLEIFDEKRHPLTSEPVPVDYCDRNPEYRHIYRFLRLLFTSAHLTAEVAIITLVYLERLLFYGELEINPASWLRMVLGAVLLASKVWDDQAVWNVDYCRILDRLEVQDMNELERQYLEIIQFNINVPSGVYAKYYFDLRTLAEQNDLAFPVEPLNKEKAEKLEATSRSYETRIRPQKRCSSLETLPDRPSTVVLS